MLFIALSCKRRTFTFVFSWTSLVREDGSNGRPEPPETFPGVKWGLPLQFP